MLWIGDDARTTVVHEVVVLECEERGAERKRCFVCGVDVVLLRPRITDAFDEDGLGAERFDDGLEIALRATGPRGDVLERRRTSEVEERGDDGLERSLRHRRDSPLGFAPGVAFAVEAAIFERARDAAVKFEEAQRERERR